eukprot:gene10580-biopygen19818
MCTPRRGARQQSGAQARRAGGCSVGCPVGCPVGMPCGMPRPTWLRRLPAGDALSLPGAVMQDNKAMNGMKGTQRPPPPGRM